MISPDTPLGTLIVYKGPEIVGSVLLGHQVPAPWKRSGIYTLGEIFPVNDEFYAAVKERRFFAGHISMWDYAVLPESLTSLLDTAPIKTPARETMPAA